MAPVLALGAVLWAAWLTGPLLSADALWLDEMLTLLFLGAPPYGTGYDLVGVTEMIIRIDPWPPLFYWLLALWAAVMGWATVALRAMPWLLGLAAVAAMYGLGRSLAGARAGALAAMGLAGSAFMMTYLHEMRGYTLFALGTILSVWLYWRVLSARRARWWVYVLLWATLVVMMYTHYLAYGVGLALGLYHLAYAWRVNRARWLPTLFTLGLAALTVALWGVVAVLKVQREAANNRGMETGEALLALWNGFGNTVPWALAALVLVAVVAHRRAGTTYLLAVALIFTVAALVVNQYADFLFHVRHMLALLPLVVALAAVGLAMLTRRAPWLAAPLMVAWLGLGAWHTLRPDYMLAQPGHVATLPAPMVGAAVALGRACVAADDVVLVGFVPARAEWLNDMGLRFYFVDADFVYAQAWSLVDLGTRGNTMSNMGWTADDPPRYAERAAALMDGAARVWVLQSAQPVPGLAAPPDVLTDWLDAQHGPGQPLAVRDGLAVTVWGAPVDDCAALAAS